MDFVKYLLFVNWSLWLYDFSSLVCCYADYLMDFQILNQSHRPRVNPNLLVMVGSFFKILCCNQFANILLEFLYLSSWEMEKEMATHSSILAWKIPWTEDPGRLQSMGSQRVGHDWTTSLHERDFSAVFVCFTVFVWLYSKVILTS